MKANPAPAPEIPDTPGLIVPLTRAEFLSIIAAYAQAVCTGAPLVSWDGGELPYEFVEALVEAARSSFDTPGSAPDDETIVVIHPAPAGFH